MTLSNARTLKVAYLEEQTFGGPVGRWYITNGSYRLGAFDKKKKAVKKARETAKNLARDNNHSVEVKIFGKDGEWQREHVYDP